MNKLRYWFSSKKRQMANLHDLQRQLQEAWDDTAEVIECFEEMTKLYDTCREQLHRVARERDECYRQQRLANMRRKKELRLAAEELRDYYMEQLENEEE